MELLSTFVVTVFAEVAAGLILRFYDHKNHK